MKLETQKQIGENLKILRTSNCMSQSEIADIAGVSRALYAGYELGKRTPDAEVLFLISSRFEINMGMFFECDRYRLLGYLSNKEVYDNELSKLVANYKKMSAFAKGMLLEKAQGLMEWDKSIAMNRKALEERRAM